MMSDHYKTGVQSPGGSVQKRGAGTWIAHRVSLVLFLGLSFWFLSVTVSDLTSMNRETLKAWFGVPKNAFLFTMLISVGLYHFWLELKEIVEDYIHYNPIKICAFVFTRLWLNLKRIIVGFIQHSSLKMWALFAIRMMLCGAGMVFIYTYVHLFINP